ncbi:MAG: class II fructose-bisphosphate aldolase [Candidatus Saganbacteria bacterium]|nr:class II fructose-bisphosphate aldolase [Candidatus Saganbacteria bacterium]
MDFAVLAPLSAHPTLGARKNGRNIRTMGFGEMYRVPVEKGNFAVVAFNGRNVPLPMPGGYEEGYVGPSTVTPVLKAAKVLEAPVIIEIASSELGKPGKSYTGVLSRHDFDLRAGLSAFVNHVFAEYQRLDMAGIPIGIHYDHGDKFDVAKACVEAGFTSVAMDGGKIADFATLKAEARKWVEHFHPLGVGVEGEIETVGGEEPTDPQKAVEFASATGVDVLVVTLSKNPHGGMPGTSVMESPRLAAARQALPQMPVNLHGGSGFGLEVLTRASMQGLFQKLNYATELFEAIVGAVPGWPQVLKMAAGKPQGSRIKDSRDALAMTDFLLKLMPKEVVEAAEQAAYAKAFAVMRAVGNEGTAKFYSA